MSNEKQQSTTQPKPSREEQLAKVEDGLVKMYAGVFNRRELLVERGFVFGKVANTRSARTGLWLSEALPDENERAGVVGRVIDRLVGQTDVGY